MTWFTPAVDRRQRSNRRFQFESLEVKRLLAVDGANIVADRFTVEQNSRDHQFDVLVNDSFDDDYASAKLITDVSLGSEGGRVRVSDDGLSLLYTPPADFAGRETFNYFVDDNHSGKVSVVIDAPLRDDKFQINPDQSTYQFDVLKNDPFWEEYQGDRKITLVSASRLNAPISISDDGKSLIYERVDHTYGLDSIVYIVDDKYPAEVSIEIANPLESDRGLMVEFDDAQSFNVIRNDPFWPGYVGDKQITHLLDVPEGVDAEISADGKSIIFDPQVAEARSRTIRYVVDAKYESWLSIRLERPTRDDGVVVDSGSSDFAIDVLANDFYYNLDYRNRIRHVDTVTSVTDSTNGGTVTIGEGNQVLYSAPEGFVGNDEFTYTADGQHVATVRVTVRDLTEDGSFRNDYESVRKGTVANVIEVLGNDFSGNGYLGDRIITAVEQVEGATIEIAEDGQHLLFTQTNESLNTFQFEYTVDDNISASVRISAESVSRHLDYEFDGLGTQTLTLVRDLDIPRNYVGNATITSITQPDNGAVASISADGKSVEVELAAGSSHFEYTIDGKHTASVTTRYVSRLSPDVGVVHMNAEEPIVIDVLENDFRSWTENRYGPYRGAKLITSVSTDGNGTAQIIDGNRISFIPAADFVGKESLTYTVDGFLQSTVNIDVARLLRNDRVHVDPGTTGELNVLGDDLVGGQHEGPLEITSVTAGDNGATITISADKKTVLYEPAEGFLGTDTFEYTVDGQLKATVTVEVNNSADDLYDKFDSLDDFRSQVVQQTFPKFSGGGVAFPIASDEALSDGSAQRDHSETNVQVDGVDEADLIETDSDFIYTLTHGHLVITKAWPADAMEVVSTTDIVGNPIGQYLYGDRLTVISEDFSPIFFGGGIVDDGISRFPSEQKTHITVFDVANRAEPKLIQRTEIEGAHVQTRRIDDYVYAVVRDSEALTVYPEFICDDAGENCRIESQEELAARMENEFSTVVEDLLPNYESYGPDGELVRTGLLIEPEDIFKPISENASTLISVVAIDITNSEPGLATTTGVLTTGASELYVTKDNLYVFENHYSWSDLGAENQDTRTTKIMKFGLDSESGGVNFAATGHVPGGLLDQFSADEYDGHLRVATTVNNASGGNYSGANENTLFVLQDDNGILEPVGTLQNLALNESIQSVRYFGEQALVTTFRTIDPLFSIDLSDHSNPNVKGHLTLPGFSSYMQFISEDKVLTIGRNTANGWGGVTMISMFDVSDILQPVLVDQYSWTNSSTSAAETDHHAFGWFAAHETLAIPSVSRYAVRTDEDGDGYKEFQNHITDHELNAFKIDVDGDSSISLNGVVSMDSPLLRSAYIGDKLYAVAQDSIISTPIASPNDVIAEVNIKPPEVDEPDPVVDPPVRLLQTVSEAARQDLATTRGVSAEDIILVSAETTEGGSKVMVRAGEEHFVYSATGSELNSTSALSQPTDARLLDWHNSDLPADSTGDNIVSPRDVLVIINAINHVGAGPLPSSTVVNQLDAANDEFQVDVNGDGYVSALDVLMVVNLLNSSSGAGEPEQLSSEVASNVSAQGIDALLAASISEDDEDE